MEAAKKKNQGEEEWNMFIALFYQTLHAIAQLTEVIAAAGAGLTSFFGWHQPKVPKCLIK